MSGVDYYVLGFRYETVSEDWADAHLAAALERAWLQAGCPADVEVSWRASTDAYAFYWYLNPAAAVILDGSRAPWRSFVIGHVGEVPASARNLLPAARGRDEAAFLLTASHVDAHARLARLLAAVLGLVQEDEWERAGRSLQEFESLLSEHIRAEEAVLFPAALARFGSFTETVAALGTEHRVIEGMVGTLRQTFDAQDRGRFNEAERQLEALLQVHEANEHGVLYPAMDRVLAGNERAHLASCLGRN